MTVEVGNMSLLAADEFNRGWAVGHHVVPNDSLRNAQVSVKWARHAAGTGHGDWAPTRKERTLAILVTGKISLEFEDDQTYILEKEGDYVIDDGSRRHRATFHEDTFVITIRWLERPE